EAPVEQCHVISGRVLSEWKKAPVEGATINLLAPRIGAALVGITDKDGHFDITMDNMPEGTRCVLQAINKKGGKEMNVEIEPDLAAASYASGTPVAEDYNSWESMRSGEDRRVTVAGGERTLLLSELEVKAQRKAPPEDVFEMLASQTKRAEDFEKSHITSLEQYLRTLASVVVRNGNVYSVRGAKQDKVGFFIDGTYIQTTQDMIAEDGDNMIAKSSGVRVRGAVQQQHLSRDNLYATGGALSADEYLNMVSSSESMIKVVEGMVPFSSIGRIDFFHSSNAVILGGARTYGGAIYITTKNGMDAIKDAAKNYYLHLFTPLGYQKPVEFYSPQYDKGMPEDEIDMRNTVYWNPAVEVTEEGKSEFSFWTNSISGTTYTIKVEGVNDAGELIHKVTKMKIK
ncbi:MAG: hypothetical protein KBT10_05145, partial [Bacteroidales bacterium]|nr:hypothetical protein [Candidatus Sodaliphilus aphodohippi]